MHQLLLLRWLSAPYLIWQLSSNVSYHIDSYSNLSLEAVILKYPIWEWAISKWSCLKCSFCNIMSWIKPKKSQYRVRQKSWYDFRGCFRGQKLEVQKFFFMNKGRFYQNLLMSIKQFFWETMFKLRAAYDLLKTLLHLARLLYLTLVSYSKMKLLMS